MRYTIDDDVISQTTYGTNSYTKDNTCHLTAYAALNKLPFLLP